MLISASYFIGEINIPINGNNENLLDRYISKYESEFLIKSLGYAFQLLVTTEVSTRMTELKNGTAYTYNGVTHYWKGLANATALTSPIAQYVFFHYVRDSSMSTSVLGVTTPKSENATVVSTAPKTGMVWNDMIDYVHQMWHFLEHDSDVYPEFKRSDVDHCEFVKSCWII